MIGTVQRKINRTKEDKDMLLYSQKLEDLYEYKNMDAFHTRKKIERYHTCRKSSMIILEISRKKKDETQK